MTPRKKPAPAVAWSETVGLLPHKITVEERLDRKGAVYLRWWPQGASNWQRRSLRHALEHAGLESTSLRDANGVIVKRVAAWAVEQAWAQYRVLAGLSPSDTIEGVVSAQPLTIGATWAVLTDVDTGLYPVVTAHAREVQRALEFAASVWGETTPWAILGRADLTKLMRRRIEDLLRRKHTGVRSTEITVSRVLSVASWLRDQAKIPANSLPHSSRWRDDMKRDWLTLSGAKKLPEINRPRYTNEESLAIMRAAWDVDPRAGLLLALSAEYRTGQARTATRSDLRLASSDVAPHGRFVIYGHGKKLGETVFLTAGQRESVELALAGYLSPLESRYLAGELKDYPLFPSGRMVGRKHGNAQLADKMDTTRPVHRDWINKTMRAVESKARVDGKPITHIEGRLNYGHRRINVDVALAANASDEALRASGGWKTTDMPRGTYAEAENTLGRTQAMGIRARRRGEAETE